MSRLPVLLLVIILILSSCQDNGLTTVTVNNPVDLARSGETIEVPLADINLLEGQAITDLRVKNAQEEIVLSQIADIDGDKEDDVLFFQCEFEGKGEQVFTIEASGEVMPETKISTYGRYIPERYDDFTWENDMIAFRIYGPALQQLKEQGDPAGGISNGPDCWLKRVSYPIVDKWYKKHVDGGTYHKDDGEGLDNYHVGSSEGCGGVCVMDGEKRYSSKNYLLHRTITNGPIRSIFEFDYAPWNANGVMMKETKRLTIDLGNRMCKWESKFYNGDLPQLGIGITLHDNLNPDINVDEKEGWIRHWETMNDNSELGTAVIVPPGKFEGSQTLLSEKPDESHLIVKSSAQDQVLSYYAGYGWSKAGAITSVKNWEAYLSNFSQRLKTPLKVTIK